MPKIFSRLLVVLAVGWTGSASSALLPPVTAGGLEWLQPLNFTGYTWSAINTVCNATTGSCNGSLGGNDLTGWTWASVDDINGLFNDYIGSMTMGPGPDRATGYSTDWLWTMVADGFRLTASDGETAIIRGRLRDSFDANNGYIGEMFWSYSLICCDYDYDIATSNTYLGKNTLGFRSDDPGAWFVRDTNASSVPISNTMALMGLALCALGFTGRQRALNT